jgi:hypothetical protein
VDRGTASGGSAAATEARRGQNAWNPLSMARASAAAGGAGIAGWAGAAAGLAPVQEAGERYLVTLVRRQHDQLSCSLLKHGLPTSQGRPSAARPHSAAPKSWQWWHAPCWDPHEFCIPDLQVADEAGSAVRRAKVQDWQPREPPRSAAGLSAWADGLVAYLQVRLLASKLIRAVACQTAVCVSHTPQSSVLALPAPNTWYQPQTLCTSACLQTIFGRLLPVLPAEPAERVVRAVLSYSGSCILGLFTDDDGVREYNILAIFRLHADIAGLQRYADSVAAVPRLRVRTQWHLC